MSNENYTVYMHRLYDGRVYIGITSKKPENRWKNGHGYSKSKKFYNAILKYGWDAFEHVILETGLTKEQAEAREVELIAEYDSTNRSKGFNVALGGHSGVPLSEEVKLRLSEKQRGKKASAETRAKMSAARKGKKHSPEHTKKLAQQRIGTHLSEETKAKISRSASITNLGRKHSDETKKKMSENNGKSRKIIQIDSEGNELRVFKSLASAARACNTTTQNIWMSANHRRAKAGGYMWRYVGEAV